MRHLKWIIWQAEVCYPGLVENVAIYGMIWLLFSSTFRIQIYCLDSNTIYENCILAKRKTPLGLVLDKDVRRTIICSKFREMSLIKTAYYDSKKPLISNFSWCPSRKSWHQFEIVGFAEILTRIVRWFAPERSQDWYR